MINNTHMNQFISAAQIAKTAGTWTPTLAANVVSDVRTAGDGVFSLLVPITLPSSSNLCNGARLRSIDLYYTISVAAADDVAVVELEKMVLPITQVIVTGVVVPVTVDGLNDSGAKRKTLASHVMTVALTAPVWMTQGDALALAVTVDAAATTVFTLHGARANFDLRID